MAQEEKPKDKPVRVGLVGAGRGGTALLELLATAPGVHVVAVVDSNPEAPGLALARGQGIPVATSHEEIFAWGPEILIEVTGRPGMFEELIRAKPIGVEVVGAQSAWLFWEMLMLRAREIRQVEKAETTRRMSGALFHSLKNLFTVLTGRSQLLLRSAHDTRLTPPELTKGLRVIAEHAVRGSEILNRLRTFTRDSGDEPVRRVEINGLVREVLALTDPVIREAQMRSAVIEVHQELGEIPPVAGRPSDLLEALMNLIVNAIEAMPAGGLLTLESAREGGNVRLRVRDTGMGIADALKDQLFTPFFTTKAGGTGLGLTISQEIIHRHGGDLAVTSAEGEGTCFTVRLPALQVGRAEKGVPVPETGKWRTLVVDDDRFVRNLLGELLGFVGCMVDSASEGAEALAFLKRESYDLVLADIVMPDITGWEVARAARAREPAPAVILLSGWIGPDDPALKESGADAFLHKPIRAQELIETVQAVMVRRLGRKQ